MRRVLAEEPAAVEVWAKKISSGRAAQKGELSRLGRRLFFSGARKLWGLALTEEDLERGPFGKPFVKGQPERQFNISHSGCWAVCALGSVPLGIDVQEHVPLRCQERLAKRILQGEEQECYRKLPQEERPAFLYRCWAKLEARGKGTGEGLAGGFRSSREEGCYQELFLEEGVSCFLWTREPVSVTVRRLEEP